MQERRRRQRFSFEQPVTLRFGSWCQIHGVVENASEIGILLVTESELPQGIPVEAAIDMPYNVRVSAPGRVERVEIRLDGQIALAVRCHRPFSESANPSIMARGSCQGMKPTDEQARVGAGGTLEQGQIITFKSLTGLKKGVLKEVKWGLVWRDFVLDDGRVIPEHKILGCPERPVWRLPGEVSQAERKIWEWRLISMAEAGLDPRDREQCFWAELNQYLAYIYLKMRDQRTGRPERARAASGSAIA